MFGGRSWSALFSAAVRLQRRDMAGNISAKIWREVGSAALDKIVERFGGESLR